MANKSLDTVIKKNLLNNLIPIDEEVKESLQFDKIYEIPLEQLQPFKNHPFKVKDDEEMSELVESIKTQGVMHPAIVRKSGEVYEIISGHRRCFACQKLGMSTLPALVVNIDDDEAAIWMVDSNFKSREHISVSEKAKAYRMKYDAIKHQGRVEGRPSLDALSDEGSESVRTVQRYLSLSNLSDELLEMVDEGKLPVLAGVELSFIDIVAQNTLCEVLSEGKKKLNASKAAQIREMAQDAVLEKAKVLNVINNDVQKSKNIVFKMDELRCFFPDLDNEVEIKKRILEILEKNLQEE